MTTDILVDITRSCCKKTESPFSTTDCSISDVFQCKLHGLTFSQNSSTTITILKLKLEKKLPRKKFSIVANNHVVQFIKKSSLSHSEVWYVNFFNLKLNILNILAELYLKYQIQHFYNANKRFCETNIPKHIPVYDIITHKK